MSNNVAQLRVSLMQQLGEVEAAAREWGVRPDHPEGRFVAALMAAQKGLADVAIAAAGAFDGAASEVGTWLNTAHETAEANARRAEAQAAGVEAKGEQAIAAVVEKMVPAATAALAGAVVIRERRRSMGINLAWLGGGAVIALALVGGGYAMKAAADRPALAFHDRCLRAAVKAESSGRLYCPVEAMNDRLVSAQQAQQRR
ncbi:hypothetical protein E2C06_12360 [Dankookia rubra]|uniref:Uncharacterized protein n=1 Tax=Dankookia rubra TaxID=1442381 RepID=A0A4R5QHF9_9PROT|nr:hypothetical protein [Dankookia rubra]TDH62393.1 hypothetical protein E2C06_12360 [Dankookia rubra]